MKIVLASSNKHKIQEINEIVKTSFPKLNVEFILPSPEFNPVEDGTTFEENSYIKAFAAWETDKTWVLADDSGLCIEALNGKPGIYSARYAETPALRIERVLKEMDGKDNRKAHFECSMTLINPNGKVDFKYTGICEGEITDSAKGTNGFGYDPIFKPDGYNCTIAELSENEKNQISHRGKALRAVLSYLESVLKAEK